MLGVSSTRPDRVLIVGGGIVGLTTAHALLSRGLDVRLLDAGPDQFSPSRGNAGQIAPGHPPIPSPAVPPRALHMMLDRRSPLHIPPRPSLPLLRWLIGFRAACRPSRYQHNMEALAHLSRESRARFDSLSDELGAAATLHPTGLADIWRTEAGERDAADEAQWLNTLGFGTESLDGAALRARDSAWGTNVRGAVIHTDGMTVDPAALCDALRKRITSLGGTIRSHCKVDRVRPCEDGWEAIQAGHRVGTGEKLIVAAGVWSSPLARMMGVRVAMQPAKGYHRMLKISGGPTISAVLREPKVSITPMGDLLRVAGTLELSGFNHRLNRGRLDQLIAGGRSFLPRLGEGRVMDEWCGLRPCTASGLPVIGRGHHNAWVAAGHGMMGVTLAPGTAALLVADILGEPVADWAFAFHPKYSR
jgi:D-amino-acid dehydrogenase